MLAGDFFAMLVICENQLEQKKDLAFFILCYTYMHRNIPFNCKSLSFALKSLGYKKSYVAISLSKLRRLRFLIEPELGIYVMTDETFELINKTNPKLAQEIKVKVDNNNMKIG